MLYLPVSLLPKRSLLSLVLVFVLLTSCGPRDRDAEQVMDEAIAAHGWQDYKQGVVSFRQENILYRVLREGDAVLYSRTFENDEGQRVHDVLAGKGFSRTIEDQEVPVGQEEEKAHSEAIRSAVFFALLPYVLKDAGKQQKYVGNVTLKGHPYHKLSVTFPGHYGKVAAPVEGNYLFWIHRDRHTLDYMVYSPPGEDKAGTRFCEAVNQREVEGIRFQDYNHYTTSKRISPSRLDYAFEAGKLVKVSETKVEEVIVTDLPPL